MFEDKILQISLIVSAAIHSLILMQMPQFKTALIRPQKKIEVVYKKEVPSEQPSKVTLSKEDEMLLKKGLSLLKNPPPFIQNVPTQILKPDILKKTQTEIKKEPLEVGLSKKISLPMSGIEMPKNPAYINYYQKLREEIRRSAYHSYSRLEQGDVYLSFILLGNGQLQEVKIVEEKTSASSYLRDVALKSIKNAAPFPAFPASLNYPQLTFNIIISFEISN